jgi:hypothetical protein
MDGGSIVPHLLTPSTADESFSKLVKPFGLRHMPAANIAAGVGDDVAGVEAVDGGAVAVDAMDEKEEKEKEWRDFHYSEYNSLGKLQQQ